MPDRVSPCCGNCALFHETEVPHIGWCEKRKAEKRKLPFVDIYVAKAYLCVSHKPVKGEEG